jgi:hypothetical protein
MEESEVERINDDMVISTISSGIETQHTIKSKTAKARIK